jgi:hypothetical protein
VKRIAIPALLIAAIAFSELGCGGPAIGSLRTVTLNATPSTNLAGEGGTLQLVASGNYSTGAQQNLTNRVTFTAVPVGTDDLGNALPNPVSATCGPSQGCGDISVSSTGMVTAVQPFVCSWVDTTPSASQASWAISGSYEITATVSGVTSQPVFVTVASAVSNTNPKGNCGP